MPETLKFFFKVRQSLPIWSPKMAGASRKIQKLQQFRQLKKDRPQKYQI